MTSHSMALPRADDRRSQRAVRYASLCGLALTVFGTIALLAGQFSWVIAYYCLPACGVLLYAFRQAAAGGYARAAIVSIVGGLLDLVDAFVSLLSGAYANPCFEVSRCTRGPTFAYVSLGVGAGAFALAAAIALFVTPGAAAIAARRR